MTDDQREILHDLNKAKVVFQARTVAAVMGFDPSDVLFDLSVSPFDMSEFTWERVKVAMNAAYQRGLSDGKGEG